MVEADIEVEFKAPLDYKETPKVTNKSHFVIDDDEKNQQRIKELAEKYKRIDGKGLTEK